MTYSVIVSMCWFLLYIGTILQFLHISAVLFGDKLTIFSAVWFLTGAMFFGLMGMSLLKLFLQEV